MKNGINKYLSIGVIFLLVQAGCDSTSKPVNTHEVDKKQKITDAVFGLNKKGNPTCKNFSVKVGNNDDDTVYCNFFCSQYQGLEPLNLLVKFSKDEDTKIWDIEDIDFKNTPYGEQKCIKDNK